MKMSTTVQEELTSAIEKRTAESFEMKTSGGMTHFISSEGQKQGMYIGIIEHDGKEFKIYMI